MPERAMLIGVILLIIGLIIGVGIGYGIWGTVPAKTVTTTTTVTAAAETVTTTVTTTLPATTVTTTTTTTVTTTVPAVTPKKAVISVLAAGDPASVTRKDNVIKACKRLSLLFKILDIPITIEVDEEKSEYFRGKWPEYEKKIWAAYEAKELWDIIAVGHEWIPTLAEKGIIIPLDDYVKKYWDFAFSDIPETLWEAVKYKGHIWAIPQDTEARPVYIWIPALKALGWTEEEIKALPEKVKKGEFTLDDMLELAKKAVDMGVVKYGILHRPSPGAELWQIILAYGGRLWDPEKGKMVLVKSATLKALQWFRKAVDMGVLPSDMTTWSWRAIHTAVVSGQTMFWFGGTWHWAEWQKVPYHPELGAVPEEYLWEHFIFTLVPPGVKGGKPVTISHPFVYVITSQADDPDLAALVLAMVTQPEFDVAHAVGSAHIPVKKSSLEHPGMKQAKFLSAVAYMLDYTSFEPMHPLWGKYKDILFKAIQAVELKKMTPEEALKFIEDSIKADPELVKAVEIVE